MKRKIVNIVLLTTALLLFIACGSSDNQADEKKESSQQLTQTQLNKTYNEYIPFIEKNLAYRSQALKKFDQLKEDEILTGADHETINKMLLNHLEIKDKLNEEINKYQYLTEKSDGYSEKDRLELIMQSLSAMLVRYDNYLIAFSNYEENKKLRERLNESNYKIPKNTLKDMTSTYNSLSERKNIKKMIEFYDKNIDNYEDNQEILFQYMKNIIEQSPSYKLGFDDNKAYTFDNLKSLYTHTFDLGSLGLSSLTNELSKGFGNSVGLVETRKGKLYDNDAITDNIDSNLKAGDILLEKTPFRLTDKLIPGHWGHAAVYIGTVQELKDLGIWENEAVKPYHEELEKGKLIVEALRDGVQLNSVEHFLNIDDFANMRDTKETNADRASRIILAFQQLGKEYDFNFDIETADKIVCSELIYITSIKIDWETEKLVGVNTISPDNVAKKSIEESSRFIITLLYHDGDEIKSDRKEMMKLLLEENEK